MCRASELTAVILVVLRCYLGLSWTRFSRIARRQVGQNTHLTLTVTSTAGPNTQRYRTPGTRILSPWSLAVGEYGARFLRVQVKRHVRASAGVPGGVISAESPLHVSNVNLVDPATGCV